MTLGRVTESSPNPALETLGASKTTTRADGAASFMEFFISLRRYRLPDEYIGK